MSVRGAQQQITATVLSWEGMTAEPHRFGGTEYRLGTRGIGHIHGDNLVDIPFPTKVRTELVNAGAAEPHHLLKDTGWVSFYLRQTDDIDRAIALLQRSYELAVAQRNRRNQVVEG